MALLLSITISVVVVVVFVVSPLTSLPELKLFETSALLVELLFHCLFVFKRAIEKVCCVVSEAPSNYFKTLPIASQHTNVSFACAAKKGRGTTVSSFSHAGHDSCLTFWLQSE